MRLNSSLLGLILLGGALPAQAQQALNLSDALEVARKNNRDLKAAQARLEQSKVGIDQAWVALIPTAAGQLKYTQNNKPVKFDIIGALSPVFAAANFPLPASVTQNAPVTLIQEEHQVDAFLNVTVPLVVPAAYPALSAAKRSYDASIANYGVSEATVLLAVAQAFFAAAGSDELLKVRNHAIEVARQTLDNAKARFETGMVNRVEVTRAELALLRAEQSKVESSDIQAQAYRALATMIDHHDPFVVKPGEVGRPVSSAGDLAKDALGRRPEVTALERTIDSTDAQIDSAAWRWAPTLSAFGLVRGFNYAGFSGDHYAWAIGAQLDWVFFDGGARDVARHLAHAQRRESEARLALLKETVADEIANADRSVSTHQQALETAQRSQALSTETLELIRAQHDAGTATQIDLLTAQDSLVAAEVAVAQARFDLALSELSLQRSAGLFPPEEVRAKPITETKR